MILSSIVVVAVGNNIWTSKSMLGMSFLIVLFGVMGHSWLVDKNKSPDRQ